MEYVIYRRLREKVLCGNVNLSYGTKCELLGEIIYFNNKPLVIVTSENAHKHFARNDDGNGFTRGKMIQKITSYLKSGNSKSIDKFTKHKKEQDEAWKKIWNDKRLSKFRKAEHADHWLWNHDFYNADISDLQYILDIIKETSNV